MVFSLENDLDVAYVLSFNLLEGPKCNLHTYLKLYWEYLCIFFAVLVFFIRLDGLYLQRVNLYLF